MPTTAKSLGSRYELIEIIGAGAMGQVWRAEDRENGDTVAAKVLRPEFAEDPQIVGRFIQERSILLTLDHPFIVKVRDLVVEGSRLAMVMDLVEGSDLRQRLKVDRTLPPGEAARLTAEVLEGLAAAHASGVLHRDVKTENVLLDETQTPATAKLTDFSIARLAQETTVKMTGVLGTAEYIAPEIFTSEEASRAVDIYGAGILLYELLAGRTPFKGDGNDFTVANRHVSVAPPKIYDIPEELWSLISTMLSKDPTSRPTASESAAELRRFAPRLAGLAAIEPMAPPEAWDELGRGVPNIGVRGAGSQADHHTDPLATNIRGLQRSTPPQERPVEGSAGPILDDSLSTEVAGAATSHITRRRIRTAAVDVEEVELTEEHVGLLANLSQNAKLALGGVAAALLVILLLVVFTGGGGRSSGTQSTGSDVTGTKDDLPLPSGLGVSRSLVVAADGMATLTVKYTGGNLGPFLEVLPLRDDQCGSVSPSGGNREATLPGCAFNMPDATGTLSFSLPSSSKYRSDPTSFVRDASTDTSNELNDLTCTTAANYLAQTYKGAQVNARQFGDKVSVNVLALTTSCPEGVQVFTTDGGQGMDEELLSRATGGKKFSFTGTCITDQNVLWGDMASPTQFTRKTPSTGCSIEITNFPDPVLQWTGSIN